MRPGASSSTHILRGCRVHDISSDGNEKEMERMTTTLVAVSLGRCCTEEADREVHGIAQ